MNKTAAFITAAALMLTGTVSAAAAKNIRGDVNGDGSVNVTDIAKTAAHVKTVKMLDKEGIAAADVNSDGKVNVTDVSLIAAYVKGVKQLPADPNSADETFEGYDAFLMFADKDMNWGNWNGQGYLGQPSFGVDADVTADGTYTVSITRNSIQARDDAGLNESLQFEEYWDGSKYLKGAEGATMLCVDITGLLDGTLSADGNELEGFLEDGENAGINKKVKGRYHGDEINVELVSIEADGWEVDFDPTKVKYGNLDEEDNCYRIEIANLMLNDADDAAIDVNELSFYDSLSVTFKITGIGSVSYDDTPDDGGEAWDWSDMVTTEK
ncbi:MAG: dockerin type I repeat-containing protein [Ruminococcus sp.]|uniref:dockerin type I repeat-containing protein n=1 Tax=Ruminococcus sp. TaxID=41978 RepID=UPI0025FA6EB9|nr:dockerin type I repeat-containing protein [Ruminococcus sp.]MBR0530591.1 dockerin type I repeat-containing protein [Ruminococcus sp.]